MRDYVAMYGEMGKQSNTILSMTVPADVVVMAQAMTAMKAVSAELTWQALFHRLRQL
jgi:hypothetical protein